MQVKDVMTRDVEVVYPMNSLMEAAQKMRALDIGLLPVFDGNHIVGMLTDRDITVRTTAEGLDPKITSVEAAMSPDVVHAFEDEDVSDVAQKMADRQLRRLIVLDRNRKLAGIVSIGDLAVDAHDDKMTGKALGRISSPGRLPH
jgi:CBS domain-containing protein